MNMMMPSMDGLTSIKILKEINSQVKIITISGVSTDQEINEVLDSGVNGFLRKPYTFSQLLNIVRDVLSESVCAELRVI
jgi:DNA-binding NarL/FixJ family response regulator